jgi:hypothetical protein
MAQTQAMQRASLEGLQGVAVVIENIKPDAHADGLSAEAIRTAVELILRSNGIRVVTQSETIKTPAAPYLYVRVSTLKNSSGLYSYDVTVTLSQVVSTVNRPLDRILAATWDNSSIGSTGAANLSKVIDSVESLVKTFANDYLAANPR